MLRLYDAKKEKNTWILYYKGEGIKITDIWYDEKTMKKILDKKTLDKVIAHIIKNAI